MMHDLAKQFASLLDKAQFDEASALMSDDCRYTYAEGSYQGPAHIAGMYRSNHNQAQRAFDEVRYASEVEPIDPTTFKMKLFDSYRLGDVWHESKSLQTLRIENGAVVEIRHEEIRGEA